MFSAFIVPLSCSLCVLPFSEAEAKSAHAAFAAAAAQAQRSEVGAGSHASSSSSTSLSSSSSSSTLSLAKAAVDEQFAAFVHSLGSVYAMTNPNDDEGVRLIVFLLFHVCGDFR